MRKTHAVIVLVVLLITCVHGLASAKDILQFGVIGSLNPSRERARYQPLVEYLEAACKKNISLQIYPMYADMLADMGDRESGDLDIAIMTPAVYAMLTDVEWLEFLATVVQGGRTFYYPIIIANKDSDIDSVGDLRGKTIGFTNVFSASGFIYPSQYLRENGLFKDGKPLYKTRFFQLHEGSVRALLLEKVDAISTYDHFFSKKGRAGEFKKVTMDSFKVLAKVPHQIPLDVIICRRNLGEIVVRRLMRALADFETALEPGDASKAAFWYERFEVENKEAYIKVNDYLKTIVEEK